MIAQCRSDVADLNRRARALRRTTGVVTARAERITLEQRRWRPGRRAELAAAGEQEAATHERVAQLSRAVVEQRHGRRLFVDEHDADQPAIAQRERILERRLGQSRGHGIER
jgi:hypothetical protein